MKISEFDDTISKINSIDRNKLPDDVVPSSINSIMVLPDSFDTTISEINSVGRYKLPDSFTPEEIGRLISES